MENYLPTAYKGVCKYDEDISVPALAWEYLDGSHFNVIGSWPKVSWLSNRRHLDQIFTEFCIQDQQTSPEKEFVAPLYDERWGLPEPNMTAAYSSLSKYGKSQPCIDDEAANLATEFLYTEFYPHMAGSKVISQEEAVQQLDKSTSVGMPYSIQFKNKKEFFAWEEADQVLREAWDHAAEPEWWWIWTNALKEEIRKKEKILENKLRTFTASPVDLTVVGTRLCADMNQKFYDSNLLTASSVGFDPYHGGWNEVYLKLKRHPHCFALDEREYDSSLFVFLFNILFQFRQDCLVTTDPLDRQRLQVLYQNIVWSVIVTADGLILQKMTGNPSGSINTIVDNTLALFWLLCYAWVKLAPQEFRTHAAFKENVSIVLTGDDNTWSVSDQCVGFFNALSVSQILSELGITTTSDDYLSRPVEDVDYLSRTFNTFLTNSYGKEICVPVLDREKFIASLRYSEKPVCPIYALTRAVGIYQVSWADEPMRNFMERYILWLVGKYGAVLQNSKEWHDALRGYKPYSKMLQFYVEPGKSIDYKAREKLSNNNAS